MAEYLKSRWEARYEGGSRRDRQGCDYEAYLPDPLRGWNLSLPSDLAADIADAETAVRDLNRTGTTHISLEGLARFLLRAESVASSRIEGLQAGPRRLVEVEAVLAQGGEAADRIAVEISGNIAAMESAVEQATQSQAFSLDGLLTIHRTLMERSNLVRYAGTIRQEQNWIGGSSYNPCSASFVPPPHEQVEALLRDLIDYITNDDHSPLVQAAIAHAQFETIHPFIDGNGRTGRALIHVVLRRRGLAPRFVPPVSLVLAIKANEYIGGLTTFRHLHAPDSQERSTTAHPWLRTFATATLRACNDAQAYSSRIDSIVTEWRMSLGKVRKESALDLLLRILPGTPLITVESAAKMINRSQVAAGDAINRLLEADIIMQKNLGRQRYRVFEAPAVLELFTSLERALAQPATGLSTNREADSSGL